MKSFFSVALNLNKRFEEIFCFVLFYSAFSWSNKKQNQNWSLYKLKPIVHSICTGTMSLFLSGLKRFSFFFHFLFFKVFPSSNSFFSVHINLTKRFFILCCFHVAPAYYKLECLFTWKKLVFTFFIMRLYVCLFYITVWRNVLRLCCWSTNAWNYVSFQCQWINIHLFWWDFLFYFALFDSH